MRFKGATRLRALVTAAVLLSAIPVLGQDSPKSILPPGFGDPVEDDKPPPKPVDDDPVNILPPDDVVTQPDRSSPRRPISSGGPSITRLPDLPSLPPVAASKDGDGSEDLSAAPILQDLPAHARRSIARVGVLALDDGDMGATAYGATRGPWLAHILRHTAAPIASRWASITLRRALLSHTNTPDGINGADFAAERAWLLLRMGEADSARLLVQAVDADQYTPWMKTVAMQSALANADPAGMCPAAEGHPAAGKDGFWMMARAICSAFSGESSLASALVDQVQDKDKAAPIDALLAEKVVGAASNSRRSVNILWEDVNSLTAWRYGLATATGLKIPPDLMNAAGARVRAWHARAPLIAPSDRTKDVELAASLGILSSSALVDHYSIVAEQAAQGASVADTVIDRLGDAYGASSQSERVAAMTEIWGLDAQNASLSYARYLATARAAAAVPSGSESAGAADGLIASMMSAGLDVQAARWSKTVSSGSLGWALLAVGSPQMAGSISASDVKGVVEGKSGKRAQFLLAGLAGLGRLDAETASSAAESLGVPLGRQNAWTKAIDKAAAARERGTVAVLAALGTQGQSWARVAPAQLFHAVFALRRVGLEAEARMIAAEAVMRS